MTDRHNEAAPYGVEAGQLRERIAVLEANYRHTIDKIDTTAERVEAIESKVDDIHAVLLQAKGARWVLVSIAVAIGFAVGTLANLKSLVSFIK